MAAPEVAHSNVAVRAIVAALALGFSAAALAAPSLKALHADSAHLQLGSAPYDLTFAASSLSATARAVNMVSADFNTDGYADLISGYAQAEGGFIAVHRGNPEAYSPTSPAAFANLKLGIFPPGFVSAGQISNLPVAPELLVAGDFNADGDPDLVFAKRGDSAIYFLPGSREGFSAAQKIALNGRVDAIAAGEIDLPNAALDLAVAISGESGASLKIYRDGIANKALDYPMSAAVTQLAIGNLDDSLMGDVAILAGGKVSILHGYNQREGVPSFSGLEELAVGSAIESLALGNFIWDRDGKTELALLQADGTLAIAGRGPLNTTPFSVAEVREKRRAQIAAKSVAMKYWQPGSGGAWAIKESNAGVVSKATALRGAMLLRANLAGQAADDLIVVDSLNQTLNLLTVEDSQRKSYSVSAASAPIVAMAIPTSNFVLPSLIVLGEGAGGPSVLPSVPKATFAVTKIADTNDGTCSVMDCSLREAIVASNAAAGADSITLPAGTYILTIANTGGVNEDASTQGDLDVIGALAITGAGLGSTIIQGGTTNADGIDKVLAFSPFCTAINMSLSDVTVRFGRNSQPRPNLLNDFSWTGGGIDVCNASAGTFAMNNVLVGQNTNLNSYGGGINLDSVAPASGNYTITGSTISGNRTTSSADTVKSGGGVMLQGDTVNVTITNSTVSFNISASEGGGVFASHVNGGAILIQGSTISGNTAASRGGGVSNNNLGASTLTLNNDGFMQNNVSQGTVAGTESRGGGIFIRAQSTSSTTINEMSITANTANTGTFQGGGGIAVLNANPMLSAPLTLTFSRIAGNLAGTAGGAGLHNADVTVTGTRNWWGCNVGPTGAPCDLAANAPSTSGALNLTPRLQLALAASPSAVFIGQSSTLTANFLTDSAGAPVALVNLDALIGTAIAFNGAVRGNLSAAQTTIQANGTATATFTATGGGAGSANSVVDAQTQTANITISVPTASIAVSPSSVLEDGLTNLTYTVTLSQAVPIATSVNFSVAGTASSGTDYTAITSPLLIAANAATGTIVVDPTSDSSIEANETVILTVAAGAGYTVGAPSSATGTITNDDVASQLSINDVTLAEGNVGTSNATFTVSLNTPAAPGGVTFDIATANGTATAGSDYVARSLTGQAIPFGSSTYTFTVLVNGDFVVEPNETFFVNVSNIINATVTDGQGQGTITNDDAAPTISAAAGLSRQQGSAVANSTIATVTDDAGNGTVVVTGASTVNGITLSGIVNTAGTISGNLVASCSATTAEFLLTATDSGNSTATSMLNVAATANTAPTQGTYGNASVAVGAGTTVTPSSAPSDTGTLASVAVAAPGFGGTLSVDQGTGVVTISNAGPAAVYTVTVTATDNCGLASTRTFTLTVTGSSGSDPTITPVAISRTAGSPFYRSVIANVSDAGGNGLVTVTVNGGSSANVGGTEIKAIQNVNGVISAAVRGGCLSTGTINFTLTASNGSASNSATLPVTVVAGGNPSWCAWWPR